MARIIALLVFVLYKYIVVTEEGNYYLAEFDLKNGGECKILKEFKFLIWNIIL